MKGEGKGLRPWVYVASSEGTFRTLHRWSGPLLVVFFLSLPWWRWGGERLLHVDIPARRMEFFGLIFGATDTLLLFVLAITAALGLGLMTAVAGRLWCGWLCPQTVFLETMIRPIEAWLEGDRGARMRLDAGPWNATRWRKKLVKWFIFGAVSLVLSMTFVSFFSDPWALFSGRASVTAYAFVAFFTFVLAFDLFWFREQFCNYLCPYARIQGVLTDRHSWVIAYDEKRGEPRLQRGDRSGHAEVMQRGGCVDCNRCVTVCPQGIDIREGFQLECIACGHCIDACTAVMERNGKATLVHYTSEARMAGKPARPWRPRPLLYGGLMVLLLGLGAFHMADRGAADATITRARGGEATWSADGREMNRYDVHLWNHGRTETHFVLSLRDWPEAEIAAPGGQLSLQPGDHRVVPVFVLAPPDDARARAHTFSFVAAAGETRIQRQATFLRPAQPRTEGPESPVNPPLEAGDEEPYTRSSP